MMARSCSCRRHRATRSRRALSVAWSRQTSERRELQGRDSGRPRGALSAAALDREAGSRAGGEGHPLHAWRAGSVGAGSRARGGSRSGSGMGRGVARALRPVVGRGGRGGRSEARSGCGVVGAAVPSGSAPGEPMIGFLVSLGEMFRSSLFRPTFHEGEMTVIEVERVGGLRRGPRDVPAGRGRVAAHELSDSGERPYGRREQA